MTTRADVPAPDTVPIDVVIPVYNAPDDLARCVESVLAHTQRPYRLILIDDGSPDERIGRYFAALAARGLPHVALLANGRNLGFIATANRGMELSRADVVLLNSDTLVTTGWLDALARCAASDPRIGTITPFSNNAEICSFPRFCVDNLWAPEADPEPVRAALARAAVPTWPDLPTGVGFCFYIRRTLVDAIGTFDPVFGPGYGEENDFCLRAVRAGYRNVLCDDAFVLHLGGRSFAGRKAELGAKNLALLLERHPGYVDLVRDYVAADPVRPIRDAALAQLRAATGPARGVLHVVHGHGGGTEHHARSLIDASRDVYRHHLAVAVGDDWQVEERVDRGSVRTFSLRRRADESWPAFVGGICATFRIGFAHLHNISGCRDGIVAALEALGIPFGYTAHDLGFACPTMLFLGADGRYCFEETDPAACRACLSAQPAFAHLDVVDWRRRHGMLLARAAFIVAPSHWVASALTRYYPDCAVEVIPHGPPGAWAMEPGRNMPALEPRARVGIPMPDHDVPTVAVLGAVGPDKGARQLERLVAIARATRASVRFVLIGYMDVQHGPWQSDDAIFTVHGRYDPPDLPDLLAHYRARLVAFPSAGPETFSFTLSEAWAAGLPVIVPPFGALAERVAGTGAGWIWTEAEWRDEARMLARIVALVAPANADALAAAAAGACRVPRPTVAAMTQRTLALYDRITPAVPATVAVLDPARVRDALGYVAWAPPSAAVTPKATTSAAAIAQAPESVPTPTASAAAPAPEQNRNRGAMVVRAAARFRQTLPGRLLYRLTPARVRRALKSRLQ